mgnify:CR=1 FL=1
MVKLIETVYNFLWGDLLTVPLPGGGTLPLSLLVILLIPTGVYFTIRTKFLPIRLFKDMVGALFEKKDEEQSALAVIQTLIVSTATRVGMGNLVGVVAAISAGGAAAGHPAVFFGLLEHLPAGLCTDRRSAGGRRPRIVGVCQAALCGQAFPAARVHCADGAALSGTDGTQLPDRHTPWNLRYAAVRHPARGVFGVPGFYHDPQLSGCSQ